MPSELELQARWYAGEFGMHHVTEDGVSLEIVNFGEWNREPGPDFKNVVLRYGAGCLVRGDIEIDLDPRNWEQHGHGKNPAFDQTVLHLCIHRPLKRCFTRTSQNQYVPQVFLFEPLLVSRPSVPDFTFLLGDGDLTRVSKILQCAAYYRLEQKAAAFERLVSLHGTDQALFQVLAQALGYKGNKIPFLTLAQRVGLGRARSPRGEALLFGLSGFLERKEIATTDHEARSYLRPLWDTWWSQGAEFDRLILSSSNWKLGSIRPVNHPHRRVAALACMAKQWPVLSSALRSASPKCFVEALRSLRHSFWERRCTLHGARLQHSIALIGEERIQDILLNVFYPACRAAHNALWDAYLQEPVRAISAKVQHLASKLAGPKAVTSSFLVQAAHQQGLLQIGSDLETTDDADAFIRFLNTLA